MPGLSHPDREPGPEPETAPIRRHVWVRGRVQNVWFRDGCAREAERLGVAGWVTNRPDGRVEAAFEGTPDAVAAIEAWCHQGPARARVEQVEARTEAPTGERGFAIR